MQRAALAIPTDIAKKVNMTMDSDVCDRHGMNKMKFGGQLFVPDASLKTKARSFSNKNKQNTMQIKRMRRNSCSTSKA